AIRVASDQFCQRLIQNFKKPIVSTSANIGGEPTPGNFSEISDLILKGVDYVVNLESKTTNSLPSSIIKLGNDGTTKNSSFIIPDFYPPWQLNSEVI
ncbi:L-threonylcarbamoyladenylate synthase, partial [Bacteroidota bacterium]